jgi:hypothetical protein
MRYILVLLLTALWPVSALSPQEIVKKIETLYQGKTSHCIAEMEIKKSNWSRTMELEMYGEGRDKFISVIRKPIKDRNTKTMKIDSEMWNYLPKIDRIMKIPSSLMGDSWMGSHFTNDDLVKGNKIDALYTFSLLKSADPKQIVIEAIPKPEAAVVWGKIMYTVDSSDYRPIYVNYYDEDNELVRTMTFSEVKSISGRNVPHQMKIAPVDNPQEYTRILYTTIEYDVPLRQDLFSIKTLKMSRF